MHDPTGSDGDPDRTEREPTRERPPLPDLHDVPAKPRGAQPVPDEVAPGRTPIEAPGSRPREVRPPKPGPIVPDAPEPAPAPPRKPGRTKRDRQE